MPADSLSPNLLRDASPLRDKLAFLLRSLQQKHPAVQRLAIALYDPDTDWVKTFLAVEDGQTDLTLYQARLQATTWLKAVADSQAPRIINDFSVLADSHKHHVQALLAAGYQSSYTLPLCVNGVFFGFLFFNARRPGAFEDSLLWELDMVGHLVALLVYNERASIRTLLATLRSAIDLTHFRDPETGNHLERMSRYARLIALAIAQRHGLDDDFVEHIYLFAPLHDLGKLGTPDHVLLKPGRLTPEEIVVMRRHASDGLQLIDKLLGNFGLSGVGHIAMLRNIVLHHHEAVDGSGYPEGLRGEAIPLEARIVTVADVFDALTSERPYKRSWSNAEAFAHLRMLAGTKLDQECVDILLSHERDILEIQQRFRENTFG